MHGDDHNCLVAPCQDQIPTSLWGELITKAAIKFGITKPGNLKIYRSNLNAFPSKHRESRSFYFKF